MQTLDRRYERLWWILAVATLLAVALGFLTAFEARAGAVADSNRYVRRVVIDDQGVRVDHGNGTTVTVDEPGRGLHGRVTVNGEEHKINIGRVVVGDSDWTTFQHARSGIVIDDEDAGLVRVFSDAEVGAGERVEGDVVAVFGSAHVRGHVTGNVIGVLGSVTLEPGAIIDGDAVAVGGALSQPPGATVNGQSVSLGFFPLTWGLPALPVLLGVIFICWLVTMFFAWILTRLFPERLLRAAVTSSRRTGLSLVLGVFSFPLMLIAVALLLVTIIGIPVALLLPIFYHFLSWSGQIAASYVLGCKLLRRAPGSRGPMSAIAAGSLFIASFFVAGAFLATGTGLIRSVALFFDLLGLLLISGLTCIGTGAFLLSKFGTRPEDVMPWGSRPASPSAAAPPAPSPPAAPLASEPPPVGA